MSDPKTELQPWQRELLDRGFERDDQGHWHARRLVLITPRTRWTAALWRRIAHLLAIVEGEE